MFISLLCNQFLVDPFILIILLIARQCGLIQFTIFGDKEDEYKGEYKC